MCLIFMNFCNVGRPRLELQNVELTDGARDVLNEKDIGTQVKDVNNNKISRDEANKETCGRNQKENQRK